MNDFFKGPLEIAMALIGVSVLTLLIGNAGNTVKVIEASGNTFNGLLRTVTLQNGYSNPFGG